MSKADEIADRAMALAAGFIDQSESELLELAGGDYEVLFKASRIVRERSTGGPALGHSAEHLAFSLIASAHEELRQQQQ